MVKSKTRQQLDQLHLLRDSGYAIPDQLLHLVQRADQERRGVVQVWDCQCDEPYESQIRVSAMECRKGHQMKMTWGEVPT
jgi:hypothetical protein